MSIILRRGLAESIAYPGEKREVTKVLLTSDADHVRLIRSLIDRDMANPMVRECAVEIVKEAGVASRDYKGQAAALLAWMQRNVYYINEGTETHKGACYTLQHRDGDCDDMVITLGAMLETIAIPTRIHLLGWSDDKSLLLSWDEEKNLKGWNHGQWIEEKNFSIGMGHLVRLTKLASDHTFEWRHIYLAGGFPPTKATEWIPMEPTMPVPFGRDPLKMQQATSL